MAKPKRIEISYEFNWDNPEIIRDCISDLTNNGWTYTSQSEVPETKKIKLVFSTENKGLIERIALNPIK